MRGLPPAACSRTTIDNFQATLPTVSQVSALGSGQLAIGTGLVAVHLLFSRRMKGLSRKDTILWVTQTTLLGFSSLLPLKKKYRELAKEE